MSPEHAQLQSAFNKGEAAGRAGRQAPDNPFRPLSDEAEYQAWEIGRAERAHKDEQA